jgi:hypothetical protein
MMDYLKREGDFYLVENLEVQTDWKYMWVDGDDNKVSPMFSETDEAEFWMFTDGQRKLFPKGE